MIIMSWKKTYKKPFKRRMNEKTNYAKRLAMIKSGKTRITVRKTSNSIIVQLIEFNETGDKIIIGDTSKKLVKLGWKHHTGNLPSAYLTGLMVAIKGKKEGINEAVLDIGLVTPVWGSAVFAALKGAIDGGLKIEHTPEILPKEDRINGTHIQKYGKVKDSANIVDSFNITKQKILGEK